MHALIVIGDSLGCPRPSAQIGLRQTYAWRLQEQLAPDIYVVNWAAGDTSSRRATADGFMRTYVRASEATYAVVQLGIVDCAPRLMSNLERVIVGVASRVPGLRILNAAYVRLKARHRFVLTRWFPKTLVSRDEYALNMRRLVNELLTLPGLRKVFLLTIAEAGPILVARSFGIADNIKSYNDVLASIAASQAGRVQTIDVAAITREHPEWITQVDGHHLTSDAHAWIAGTIARHIEVDRAQAEHPR